MLTVITAVAMPGPAAPHKLIASTVASAEAEMLTMLFPMRIAAMNLFGLSRRLDNKSRARDALIRLSP